MILNLDLDLDFYFLFTSAFLKKKKKQKTQTSFAAMGSFCMEGISRSLEDLKISIESKICR